MTLFHQLSPNLLRPLLHTVMIAPDHLTIQDLHSLWTNPMAVVMAEEVGEVVVVVQPQGVRFATTSITQPCCFKRYSGAPTMQTKPRCGSVWRIIEGEEERATKSLVWENGEEARNQAKKIKNKKERKQKVHYIHIDYKNLTRIQFTQINFSH